MWSHPTREICTISIVTERSLHGHIFLTAVWLYLPSQRFPLLRQLERVWMNRIQYARIPLCSLVRFAQESGRKSTIWRFVCFICWNYFIFHRLEYQNFSVWKPVSRWLVVSRQVQTAKEHQGLFWITLGIENTHVQFQSRSGFPLLSILWSFLRLLFLEAIQSANFLLCHTLKYRLKWTRNWSFISTFLGVLSSTPPSNYGGTWTVRWLSLALRATLQRAVGILWGESNGFYLQ